MKLTQLNGALIIGLEIKLTAYQFIRVLLPPQVQTFYRIRLLLTNYLALALEFQLGADILSTAIAPTWTQIGKLGAVSCDSHGVELLLTRKMREEEETTESEKPDR